MAEIQLFNAKGLVFENRNRETEKIKFSLSESLEVPQLYFDMVSEQDFEQVACTRPYFSIIFGRPLWARSLNATDFHI